MARKTKVATLKKRLKSKPFAYVDKKGNVRHFARGKRSSQLQKKVVGAAILKKRRAKGKKGILLYVKGKNVMSVPRKAGGKRKKRKKAKKRRGVRRAKKRKKRKGRKRGRKRTSARKRKSRRCPKTRTSRSLRAAMACVRAGKGGSIAKKKVYNKAVKRLRKSKKGRAYLKKRRIRKLAKIGRKKARKRRRKRRR
jgi:hypothetical protein